MSGLVFTYWPDITGREARQVRTTWRRFVDGLRRLPPQPEKHKAPLVKLATFGDVRTSRGSLRHDGNVLEVTGVEGDQDTGVITPEEAVRRLERHLLRAVVVTTWSHTAEIPRLRVFAPLSRPHSPPERTRFAAGLNGALGGVLGEESFTLSRSFFIGGRPGGEYRVLHTFDDPDEGYDLDAWDNLDEVAIYPPERQADRDPSGQNAQTDRHVAPVHPRYVQAAIERECLELAQATNGSRNNRLNVAAFNLARFVAAGEADAGPVIDALSIAAAHAGLPDREIGRTIQSAFEARGVAA